MPQFILRPHGRLCIFASAVTLAIYLTALSAVHSADGSRTPAHGPQSAIFQQLKATYGSLKSYQAIVKSTAILQPVNGSKPNTFDTTLDIRYKSPNLFRIDEQGLMGGGLQVSDGKTLYIYSAMMNQYSVSQAPKSVLAELLSTMSDAPAMAFVGPANIGGDQTTEYTGRSRTNRGQSQITAYIDRSTHLIRRLVVKRNSLPGPRGADFRLILQEDYTAQKLNPVLPANLFHFVPASGAMKTKHLEMPSITGFSD